MRSKIVFFFMIITFTFINVSCGDKFTDKLRDKHIIPYVPVYTVIDLGIGGEGNNWAFEPKFYTVSSEGKPLGYGGHGIIIYTTDNEDYKCYDATCTNCPDLNSYFTIADYVEDALQCPVCGTRFMLSLYGYPIGNDKDIYSLKEYPITKSGNKLRISY